ncbi:eukaryotic translation initiation factor 4 gamma 3-like [Octopus sinensis]|uniref:Eukaryotic translation initiation factor 4 gamma 3-like n=1 Tax=Octopus sinensis TaxID=2607531 RepID=A0A7E6FID1_9MOLL|nr:eukaryotic translation initiation factor 4 gamma 3-like [Octopus sinensis]
MPFSNSPSENAYSYPNSNVSSTEETQEATQRTPLPSQIRLKYDRDFILKLQYKEASLTKPVGLPDLPEILFKKPQIPKQLKYNKIRRDIIPFKCSKNMKSVDEYVNDSEDEELNTKMKNIASRLAPEKYKSVLSQIRDIQIDKESKLVAIMNLLFEKATSDPMLSTAYAYVCRCLTLKRVPSIHCHKEVVNVHKVLNKKCQKEFEKYQVEEAMLNKKLQQIEDTDNNIEKLKFQKELVKDIEIFKRKSQANVRFLCELFKLGVLRENTMQKYIKKMLQSLSENSLESVCLLFNTIGERLDTGKKFKMDVYFIQLKSIAEENSTPNRLKLMIENLISLRENQWNQKEAENHTKQKGITSVKDSMKEETLKVMANSYYENKVKDIYQNGDGSVASNMGDIFSSDPGTKTSSSYQQPQQQQQQQQQHIKEEYVKPGYMKIFDIDAQNKCMDLTQLERKYCNLVYDGTTRASARGDVMVPNCSPNIIRETKEAV